MDVDVGVNEDVDGKDSVDGDVGVDVCVDADVSTALSQLVPAEGQGASTSPVLLQPSQGGCGDGHHQRNSHPRPL